jgi:glyoxylase-like metal-dependent hydrolase (beta-lactamase superfamily II)
LKAPASLRVIVRDWLCCNQVLLLGGAGNVLVDSGHVARGDETLALLRRPENLGAGPLARLINTHCHSDHMGGNAAVHSAYGCNISVPVDEAPLVERWDTRGLWLDWAGQRAERFDVDDALSPGDIFEAGGMEWQALAAPGHDAGALVFWCETQRILISGDALWERGFGIVLPDPPGGLRAARTTLERLRALDARLVIPGHGEPFTDVQAALERCFARLQALESDADRAVRSVLKAMLSFALLEQGRLPLAELPEWMQSVPMYREYNQRYFRLEPAALAEKLVQELERSGAVRREGDWLFPRQAA